MITAEQIKGGRALLGWSAEMLAKRTGCSVRTVWVAEDGGPLNDRTTRVMPRIQATLEAAGVEFIPKNGGGAGVRLREAPET